MKRLLVLILFVVLLLCACATQGVSVPSESESQKEPNAVVGNKKISGDEAAEMMSGDVVIIDVRTQDEYDEGHIPNAVLLPYDTITAENAGATAPDKDQTILVYCRTGRRSEAAAKALIELGYTAVYDFGGLETDWNGAVVK